LLTRELQVRPIEVVFRDSSELRFEVNRQYQRLEEDFEISDGIVLPLGAAYDFTRYRFRGSTAPQYVVGVDTGVEIGDFFSGRRRGLSCSSLVSDHVAASRSGWEHRAQPTLFPFPWSSWFRLVFLLAARMGSLSRGASTPTYFV
jgi:hypothetical protein